MWWSGKNDIKTWRLLSLSSVGEGVQAKHNDEVKCSCDLLRICCCSGFVVHYFALVQFWQQIYLGSCHHRVLLLGSIMMLAFSDAQKPTEIKVQLNILFELEAFAYGFEFVQILNPLSRSQS